MSEHERCGTCLQTPCKAPAHVHELWVNNAYWQDHVDCECSPGAEVVKRKGHLVLVRMSECDYSDFRSRVDYYRDPTGLDAVGLCRSAQSVWKRIQQYEAQA